jgi:hypothetical protein
VAELLQRVPETGHDPRPRVRQGAVEVEQNGVGTGRLMLGMLHGAVPVPMEFRFRFTGAVAEHYRHLRGLSLPGLSLPGLSWSDVAALSAWGVHSL